MYPDMFSTMVIDDVRLHWSSIGDGIQQCATYNPPGPSTPGYGTLDSPNLVWFIRSLIFFHNWVNNLVTNLTDVANFVLR